MPNPFQLGLFDNGFIPQDASAFTLDSLPYAIALTFQAYVNSKLIGPQILGLEKIKWIYWCDVEFAFVRYSQPLQKKRQKRLNNDGYH